MKSKDLIWTQKIKLSNTLTPFGKRSVREFFVFMKKHKAWDAFVQNMIDCPWHDRWVKGYYPTKDEIISSFFIDKCHSGRDFIDDAFDWDETFEGFSYWDNLNGGWDRNNYDITHAEWRQYSKLGWL